MARHTFIRSTTSYWMWIGIAVAILLADQFTKVLIISTYQLGEGFAVTSFSISFVCTTKALRSRF